MSSFSIQTSSVIENNKIEQEPLWGSTHLFVVVKEEYGDPEDPQYRNMSSATVYFWQYFKLIIPFVYYSKLLSPNDKQNIFSKTAIAITTTNENGVTGVHGQCWHPLLLIYVEKEGYKIIDNNPFKLGSPNDPSCSPYIKFIMKKI